MRVEVVTCDICGYEQADHGRCPRPPGWSALIWQDEAHDQKFEFCSACSLKLPDALTKLLRGRP